MARHRTDSIREKADRVRYKEGDAIAGDTIIYEARKVGKVFSARGPGADNIFQGTIYKNAYAKINKIYTNRQK